MYLLVSGNDSIRIVKRLIQKSITSRRPMARKFSSRNLYQKMPAQLSLANQETAAWGICIIPWQIIFISRVLVLSWSITAGTGEVAQIVDDLTIQN